MADHDALSLFYDVSMGFTHAVEKYLELMAWGKLGPGCAEPKVWLFSEQQAWSTVYEVAGQCLELGAASVKFSHEILAFLSNLGEINNTDSARSPYSPLAMAIEDITTTFTELQKAGKTAMDTVPTLKEGWGAGKHMEMSLSVFRSTLPWYFENNQGLPLGDCAAKLGQILLSMNIQEVANTGVLNSAIAVYQGHVVRVCLHALPLIEGFGLSLSITINGLSKDGRRGETDYMGALADFMRFMRHWMSDEMRTMLGSDVVSALMHLETHLLSDLPSGVALPLSNVLMQYGTTVTSLLNALSSVSAVEQHLNKLMTINTHVMLHNPSIALHPLSIYQEAAQRAATKACDDVNLLISQLEQLLDDPFVTTSPTPSENEPDPLKCIRCEFTNLLLRSQGILAFKPGLWTWILPTTELGPEAVVLDELCILFLSSLRARRHYHLTIFGGLFPCHQLQVDNPADVDVKPPTAVPPPSPLGLAFGPHHNPELFQSPLSTLANDQEEHYFSEQVDCPFDANPKFSDHWRSCACKEQKEFAAETHRMKYGGGWQRAREASHFPNAKSHSKKALAKTKKKYLGTFQGDWSF